MMIIENKGDNMTHKYNNTQCSVDETYISVWPSLEWCYTGEEPDNMSDDYQVICVGIGYEEEEIIALYEGGRL